jgi:hypothetical protein
MRAGFRGKCAQNRSDEQSRVTRETRGSKNECQHRSPNRKEKAPLNRHLGRPDSPGRSPPSPGRCPPSHPMVVMRDSVKLELPPSPNPSRISTCITVSKQGTLTFFRMNTYKKPGMGVTFRLTPELHAPSDRDRTVLGGKRRRQSRDATVLDRWRATVLLRISDKDV